MAAEDDVFHCTAQNRLSSHSHWDQRRADIKQADVYSDICLLHCLAHSRYWVCKCKLFLSYTLHSFSWWWFSKLQYHELDKAGLSLLHYFLSHSPSPPHMTVYLASGRAEIIPAWLPVLTLFWSLVTMFKRFSHHTLAHSLLSPSFLLTPCVYVLYLSTLFSFSDNLCCQPPLSGVYPLFFFFLLSSSKLTSVLFTLMSFIAHNFLVFSSFLYVFFWLLFFTHWEICCWLPCPCHPHLPVPMGIFLDAFYWSLTTDFVETSCSNTAKALAVSVHCPSLWMVRHDPSPAGATSESQKWGE